MIRFLCLLLLAGSLAAATPPNIVFIISDDHAWTDYGFMGHPQIETPNLDRLQANSAAFTRGYVPTALCRPALACFANGLYAHQNKITGNDPSPLPGMAAGGKAKGAKGKAKAGGEPEAYKALRGQLIDHFYEHPALPAMLAK